VTVLFDTSVLVAGLVERRESHARAVAWLRRAQAGEIRAAVSTHTLAQLYAVLTRLPLTPRIAPRMALDLIERFLQCGVKVVALDAKDYLAVLAGVTARALPGGIVYDALHAEAARKCRADRLLTLNPADSERTWSEGADRIASP